MLTFMEPTQRPTPDVERRRYEQHRNDPDDPGYRKFLDQLAAPLAARLRPGARGLDYGSGPGPTLSRMLEERGFRMSIHDPFFAPDPLPLATTWDFITCTEVFEHFFEPARELERLRGMLRPGGLLGVMTELLEDDTRFDGWRYARDPTHVCFYRIETMRWIARRYDWTFEHVARNAVIFGDRR
jgi:SAM-dependent methyltransferase